MINNVFEYLIEAGLYLTLIWLIYRLVLVRFTFFQLNRLFLLAGLVASIALPFTPKLVEVELHNKPEVQLEEWFGEANPELILGEEISDTIPLEYQSEDAFPFTWTQFILGIGMAFFLCRFLWIFFYSLWIVKTSKKVWIDRYEVCFHKKIDEPCSLFSKILLPSSWKDTPQKISNELIIHEQTHTKQLHWFDLFLSELVLVAFWFFPIAYWLKKDIRLNLEFLADSSVLKNASIQNYQQLLWEAVQPKASLALAQMFYANPIKTRFKMMKKNPTSIWKKAIYLLLLPLLITPTVAFKSAEMKLVKPAAIPLNVEELLIFFDETEFYPDYPPIKEEHLTRISSGFGMRMHPIEKKRKMHTGIDFSAPKDTPIYAAAAGIIKVAKVNGKHGKMIALQHGDTDYLTRYSHLANFNVQEGQVVKKGEKIGYVGSTGQSFGPHLHFEIRKDGKAINPINFLKMTSK